MIRHCVFFRFRGDVDPAERKAIYAELDSLRRVVDGMGEAHYGQNVSSEPFSRGFVDGFTIDFHDESAREAYLAHEIHQRAGARLVAAIDGGLDSLMVFDLELS